MTLSDSSKSSDIDSLLNEWSMGNINIENQLIDLLYPDIHKIAHFQLKSNSASALQTTEIVNEAFIKLGAQKTVNWKNKKHFLAISAKVIRRVAVDHYRAEMRQKRGGSSTHFTLERIEDLIPNSQNDVFNCIELDDLLQKLSEIDAEAALVVEYKIFGGMSIPEISHVMSVSESYISRSWKFARTWLLRQYKTQKK